MMREKVVHLTSVHPHFDIRIFHKECKRLAKSGYEVTLIAPRQADEPTDELVDGVRIRAVKRPGSRWERAMSTIWRVLKAALKEEADVYHFHDPELIPVGVLLKLCGKKVIYDVHENVPDDVLMKDYIPRPARRIIASVAGMSEHLGAAVFDGIVAANPVIAKRFPVKKTAMVQNFAMLEDDAPGLSQPYGERSSLVAYVGVITAQRGMKEMVQAMSLLPASLAAKLVLAGRFGPAELEQQARALPGWNRTEFVGWLPRPDVLNLLGRARLGLVLAHPFPGDAGQPNKLFEYMCAGIPVVASGFPKWRQLVEETGCGLLVDRVSPELIAEPIQYLLEHPDEAEMMGRRGLQSVRNHFNWTAEGERLLNLYETVLQSNAVVGRLA